VTPFDPLIGSVVDGFRFDALLGRGNTGFVYRATQIQLGRTVAVKVPSMLLASDETAMRRFRREATALARLVHPGVVTVHALGTVPDGRPYLAIDYLDGETLEIALAPGPLAPARALEIARQIAEALAETHAHGIVHRDLKPANVMLVQPRAGGERAVLIDFGIALPISTPDATRLTAGGGLVGTPHYMAPEQIQGDDVDGRADIYALGATLYRMLTGRVPFTGTGVEVVVAHLARSVENIRSIDPSISPAIEAVVMKCLQKRASQRYATATELVVALRAAMPSASTSIAVRHRDPTPPPARAITAPDESSLVTGRRRRPEVGTDADSPAVIRRRVDTPEPTEYLPPMRSRWPIAILGLAIAGGIAAGIALIVPELVAREPTARVDGAGSASAGSGSASAAAEPEPSGPVNAIVVDDGGLSMRVVVPATIPAGVPVRLALEIWDDEGRPVDAKEVIVTLEGDDGTPRGFAASRAGLGRTVFAFTTTFATPGAYKLRVFPPIGDTTFVVDLDVD
jgi:serine/threonine-protein kinase